MKTYLCIGGPKAGEIIPYSRERFEARLQGMYLGVGPRPEAERLEFRTGVYQRRVFVFRTKDYPKSRAVECYVFEGIDDNEASKVIEATLEWAQAALDNSFASCAR